jgi:hypothetical protein
MTKRGRVAVVHSTVSGAAVVAQKGVARSVTHKSFQARSSPTARVPSPR